MFFSRTRSRIADALSIFLPQTSIQLGSKDTAESFCCRGGNTSLSTHGHTHQEVTTRYFLIVNQTSHPCHHTKLCSDQLPDIGSKVIQTLEFLRLENTLGGP